MKRRFLELVFSRNSRYSSDKLYIETGMLDIRQLYFLSPSFSYNKNKQTALLPNHQYNTHQRNHYTVPLMTKVVSQRSFSYYAPKLFNQISDRMKLYVNICRYKK